MYSTCTPIATVRYSQPRNMKPYISPRILLPRTHSFSQLANSTRSYCPILYIQPNPVLRHHRGLIKAMLDFPLGDKHLICKMCFPISIERRWSRNQMHKYHHIVQPLNGTAYIGGSLSCPQKKGCCCHTHLMLVQNKASLTRQLRTANDCAVSKCEASVMLHSFAGCYKLLGPESRFSSGWACIFRGQWYENEDGIQMRAHATAGGLCRSWSSNLAAFLSMRYVALSGGDTAGHPTACDIGGI